MKKAFADIHEEATGVLETVSDLIKRSSESASIETEIQAVGYLVDSYTRLFEEIKR